MPEKEDLELKLLNEQILQKKQELDEAYKGLTYWETAWSAAGIETGNERYDNLNKQYVELQLALQKEEPTQNQAPGLITQFTNAIGDGASAIQYVWEVAQILPDLTKEYNNFKNLKAATNPEERTNKTCQMIKDGGPLLQNLSGILNSPTVSEASKSTLLDYVTPKLNPILNKVTGKLTSQFYAEGEKPNLLKNVSPDFNRKVITTLADLGANALADDSNINIQNIYRELAKKENKSLPVILENVKTIINSDKVNGFIKKDLNNFLSDPENQKEIAKITSNIINNEVKEVIAPKLLENTIGLVLSQSNEILQNAPQLIDAYQDFNKINTIMKNNLLASEGNLPKEARDALLEAMNQDTRNLLNNATTIINNLTPGFEKDLPKLLLENKSDVISLLNTLKLPEKIKAAGISDEVSKNTVEALPELIADAAPMITKIMQSSLKEPEKLLDIVQQAQAIKLAPKEEKKNEIKKLISSALEFEKNNPELKNTIETELPKLLDKHSKTLAPLVEDFLNKTPIGQKIKLDGEKILEIVGKETPALVTLAKAYNDKQYSSMVKPVLTLLTDPKVLGFLIDSSLNLAGYKVKKIFGKQPKAVGPHTEKVLNERTNEGLNTSRSI